MNRNVCAVLSMYAALFFSGVLVAWPQHPLSPASLPEVEQILVRDLPPDRLKAYLDGTPASEIHLNRSETLESMLTSVIKGIAYGISFSSIDAGSLIQSSGGVYELGATIGQPDAGTLSGADFQLTGGFWAVQATSSGGDSCNSPDKIFCDGFESGDVTLWTSSDGA